MSGPKLVGEFGEICRHREVQSPPGIKRPTNQLTSSRLASHFCFIPAYSTRANLHAANHSLGAIVAPRHLWQSIKLQPLKTKAGKRSLVIVTKTIQVLRSHFDRQHVERKAAGERWQERRIDHNIPLSCTRNAPISATAICTPPYLAYINEKPPQVGVKRWT